MRKPIYSKARWLIAAFVLAAAGCSFIVDFDPEGKLCGQPAECITGYWCDTSSSPAVCRAGEQPAMSPDASVERVPDAAVGGPALPKIGESCAADAPQPCVAEAWCNGGTCVAYAKLGEACPDSTRCIPGTVCDVTGKCSNP